ncbi:hypothetical protein FHS16_005083 [Paenibacillus endophyticus]|uniref:Uncharacterized protein n=1 Tax=Paenibacillus endophyticus TaxID=1294268 RepID=A0A7W5CDQ8_9BACL|nr:hypothetical protein [Paenibacillus endophyticus]
MSLNVCGLSEISRSRHDSTRLSKVKRLSPYFGGAARFIPRNIENVQPKDILSYISKTSRQIGPLPSRALTRCFINAQFHFPTLA